MTTNTSTTPQQDPQLISSLVLEIVLDIDSFGGELNFGAVELYLFDKAYLIDISATTGYLGVDTDRVREGQYLIECKFDKTSYDSTDDFCVDYMANHAPHKAGATFQPVLTLDVLTHPYVKGIINLGADCGSDVAEAYIERITSITLTDEQGNFRIPIQQDNEF